MIWYPKFAERFLFTNLNGRIQIVKIKIKFNSCPTAYYVLVLSTVYVLKNSHFYPTDERSTTYYNSILASSYFGNYPINLFT